MCLPGLPVSLKYCLASFQAVSTASPPPVVKNTRLRSPGGELGQPLGQLDRGRVRVGPEREEGQLARLLGGRLGQLLAAVPDLYDEEPGQPVEVPLAAAVPDVGALAAHDHRHVGVGVRRQPGEVHPEVVARGALLRLVVGGIAHRVPHV